MTKEYRALLAINAAIIALDHVESGSIVEGFCDEIQGDLLAARSALGQGPWPELFINQPRETAWLLQAEQEQHTLGLI